MFTRRRADRVRGHPVPGEREHPLWLGTMAPGNQSALKKLNLSFERGNVVGALKSQVPITTTQAGKGVNGTIKSLSRKTLAGFGNRVTDGFPSQTGALSGSGEGYAGSLEPIINLMLKAGYGPRRSAASFISSTTVAPPVATNDTVMGRLGLQPISRDSLTALQKTQFIPPNQSGGYSSRYSKYAKGLSALDPTAEGPDIGGITIAPYTINTVHEDKFGADGDPNPLYPLTPMDPATQQANMVDEVGEDGKWNVADPVEWAGYLRQESGAMNTSSARELRAGVQNYLWSRTNNASVRAY